MPVSVFRFKVASYDLISSDVREKLPDFEEDVPDLKEDLADLKEEVPDCEEHPSHLEEDLPDFTWIPLRQGRNTSLYAWEASLRGREGLAKNGNGKFTALELELYQMKFFTSDIYKALEDLDTEVQGLDRLKEADRKYKARLSQVRETFPPALSAVADAWAVDDALIAKLRQSDDPATLELVLRCGNLQIGYFDLDFTYDSPEVSDEHLRALIKVASNIRGNCLFDGWDAWVHEVDRLSDGRIEHRIYFHKGGWVAIRCRDLQVVRTEKLDRRLPPYPNRYRVARFSASSRSA